MNKAFYTGASGLRAYQHDINIIGHNVVNSGTTGYKATIPEFRELINNNMDVNINRELPADNKVKEGNGVRLWNDDMNFTQGKFQTTEYPLDFLIAGDGFFALDDGFGNIQYTRNGSFDVSIEGEDAYLVNADGMYVLDQENQRIKLDYIGESNTLDVDTVKPRLGVFSFTNPNGLTRTDGGSFLVSENSGQPEVANRGEYTLYQGSLEASNVELSQEMTNLIIAQRAYQFSSKVVTTSDEIEQLVNSLRG
jgi:flagellar basal body rod protein FlgG